MGEKFVLPWVPEVFLACGGNFRCWPKADTSSAVGRSQTGNRARIVSGTQGKFVLQTERNIGQIHFPIILL